MVSAPGKRERSDIKVTDLLIRFYNEGTTEGRRSVMDAIVKAKPAAAKGQYIKSVAVSSTMGPGIKVNYAKL